MARRSHPPTLITLARRQIREAALLQRGQLVLCACSGGPDSSALLHVLAHLRKRLGHRVAACGVDHGLRTSAAEELLLAQQLAAQLDVPFTQLSCRVTPGANLQARARKARHQLLQQHAAELGAAAIALGHSADDRAETVLLRLLRGAGPTGLAVMPPRSVAPPHRADLSAAADAPDARTDAPVTGATPLIRPLLLARRADVLAHLARHDIAYALDPSNRDRRFMRTRVRHEVLPLLQELNPQIVPHLCALADMLTSRRDASELPLGRAQRLALERALRLRQPATLWLKGGGTLELSFSRAGAVRKPKA